MTFLNLFSKINDENNEDGVFSMIYELTELHTIRMNRSQEDQGSRGQRISLY